MPPYIWHNAPHVQPAPGGSYHVYPDGHKVFVAHPATAQWQAAADRMQAGTPQPGTWQAAYAAMQAGHAVPGTWQAAYENTHGVNPTTGASVGGAATAQAAATPGADPTSPMDSTLAEWMATHQAQRDQQLTANEQQGTSNLAAYQEALRRLNERQPIDEQNQRQSANKQGLFYSGHLGQSLGRLAQSYVERRADQRGTYDTAENARLAARGAIKSGYDIGEAAARAEAADRQIGSDTTAAGNNALVPNPDAVDPNAAPAAPAVPTTATTVRAPTVRKPRVPAVSRVVQSVAPTGMGAPTRAPTTFRQTRKPRKRT
jgi:hypothetical protein